MSDEATNPGVQEASTIGGYFCTPSEDVLTSFDSESDHFLSTPQVTINEWSADHSGDGVSELTCPPMTSTDFSSSALEDAFVASLNSDHAVPDVSFLHPGGVIPSTLRSELPFRFDKEKDVPSFELLFYPLCQL